MQENVSFSILELEEILFYVRKVTSGKKTIFSKTLQNTSFEPQMYSKPIVLLPVELRSGDAEPLRVSGGEADKAASSLERLSSEFLRFRHFSQLSMAVSLYSLLAQEKSQL